jgi:hypothetical protein
MQAEAVSSQLVSLKDTVMGAARDATEAVSAVNGTGGGLLSQLSQQMTHLGAQVTSAVGPEAMAALKQTMRRECVNECVEAMRSNQVSAASSLSYLATE